MKKTIIAMVLMFMLFSVPVFAKGEKGAYFDVGGGVWILRQSTTVATVTSTTSFTGYGFGADVGFRSGKLGFELGGKYGLGWKETADAGSLGTVEVKYSAIELTGGPVLWLGPVFITGKAGLTMFRTSLGPLTVSVSKISFGGGVGAALGSDKIAIVPYFNFFYTPLGDGTNSAGDAATSKLMHLQGGAKLRMMF